MFQCFITNSVITSNIIFSKVDKILKLCNHKRQVQTVFSACTLSQRVLFILRNLLLRKKFNGVISGVTYKNKYGLKNVCFLWSDLAVLSVSFDTEI